MAEADVTALRAEYEAACSRMAEPEFVRGMAEMMRQRAAADPLFAEDCESLFESMPYLIRYDGAGRPVICECCGTYVCDLLEADSSEPRRWRRAIWEAETARKHTLRRCTWIRDHGSLAPPPAPIGLGPGRSASSSCC